jgi:EmrB/QacA subfamily drug resistance transporter
MSPFCCVDRPDGGQCGKDKRTLTPLLSACAGVSLAEVDQAAIVHRRASVLAAGNALSACAGQRRTLRGALAVNRTVPLILAVALFMENMDSTVIATSLPAIAADIGTSPITLKLALTSYFVALAIFIPISGWMADRYGAKRIFRLAIGVFVAGSVACAFSNSLAEFVGSRFLQGMGGAMMTPVGRLVLVRSTPRAQLVQAMAWLTVPALIGPLVGPPVGGFITTFFSWHWIFLINVPIGIVGIWLAGRVLPEIEAVPPGRLDAWGFVLAGMAAAGVVFGLSVISMPALPPVVGLGTLALGVGCGLAYLRHWRRVDRPLLDFTILATPAVRAAVLSGSLFRIGVGAAPFLLPLMFQIGFGLSPFESGMLTFASAFGAIAMKFVASTALRLGGFRTVLIVATLAGSVLMAVNGLFRPDTPYALIIAVLVASGLMRSLYFTCVNALVFAEIENAQAAQATAISAVAQQISIALGVAVAGLVLETHALVTGEAVGMSAFIVAFPIVGILTALAVIPLLSLPPTTGRAVSGHGRARDAAERPELVD